VKKIQKILDYELDSEFICPSVEVDFNITQWSLQCPHHSEVYGAPTIVKLCTNTRHPGLLMSKVL
jgi:hypothetical protein